MKLCEIKNESARVVAEGEFSCLGNIDQNKLGQMAFVESAKYIPMLKSCSNITCVVTRDELAELMPEGLGVMVSEHPRRLYYEIHNRLARETDFYGRPTKTVISDSSDVHPRAYVAGNNVRIGERCLIGPNVSILENSLIEDDVIIRAGAVISSEGFRFERFEKEMLPVLHTGGVHINKGVEIQANTCVDRAKFGGDYTVIGESTKIDNLVHIAHNAVIGKRCMIAACALVAGSTVVGDDVWIGPNATISNKLTVGEGAFITMGAVVTRNVSPNQRISGNFAIDHGKFIDFIKSIS
ncbi:MAG: UDP-3-O-(3-hydroxymyristoyl)glucosamine N-acyltransferase [Methanosarcinales archaeon]|nr:UDP-3-O-(3-hydroxymyristoyl)glucosamine N-acyltransferase [Methanosarcinales archaeon]